MMVLITAFGSAVSNFLATKFVNCFKDPLVTKNIMYHPKMNTTFILEYYCFIILKIVNILIEIFFLYGIKSC